MKNDKKVIDVIKAFPLELTQIKAILRQEHTNHILEASNYLRASFLLKIAQPDVVFLNLKLTSGEAIKVVSYNMERSFDIKVAMITTSPYIYCKNLAKYLQNEFSIESPVILN